MTVRPRRVVVEARAKLNLGLAVGPARADGFHDLATVFQSISLADTLTAVPRRSGFTLRVRHENVALRGAGGAAHLSVPAGGANLVLQAARLTAECAGIRGGAAFELVKRIPARSGLGGGSADAAAAIVALCALHGLRVSRTTRLEIAAQLGSDVPFALIGGTAVGLGRGDRLRPTALDQPFRAIVAVPAWTVSTPEAFRQLDLVKYGLTGWKTKLRFAQSIGRRRLGESRAAQLGNSFEAALGKHRSDFESLCDRLADAGVERPRLTGSGSAVFGIVPARVAVRTVVERFPGGEALFVVRTMRTGVSIAARS